MHSTVRQMLVQELLVHKLLIQECMVQQLTENFYKEHQVINARIHGTPADVTRMHGTPTNGTQLHNPLNTIDGSSMQVC
jgi:hypothetical protein